jgi:EpsD family peptidyl-prolyl cis-trans isomerase
MKLTVRPLLVPLCCLALGACHLGLGGLLGKKAPTGQVAATVGGQEITLLQLRAELTGVNLPDDKARKAGEQAALREIIARKLIAAEARNEGLDKKPDFILQKQRLEDTLLAQALQAKIVQDTPAPSTEEANHFIADHPDIFANRKIFTLEQIRMPRPANAAMVQALQPLNTLDEVEAYLKQQNIPYQRQNGTLDAVGADPQLIDAVVKLPANELFVVPTNEGLVVNHIVSTREEPFTGDAAVKYAVQVLTVQHRQQAVRRAFNSIFQRGLATVSYNKDFAPPAKPAAGAAQSGAPAPSSAAPKPAP